MKKLAAILLALAPIIAAGCYYDTDEALYPTVSTVCDTTGVTFTKRIQPLLSANCYGCHSNNNALSFGDGITLENYDDVVSMFNKLYASVTYQPGARQMPKNSAQLSACALRQLAIWKQNGFPQ